MRHIHNLKHIFMKNILKSLLMIGIFFATVSCTEDFLEKEPQGSLDPSRIGDDQIEEYRNSLYAQLPGIESIFNDSYADNSFVRNWWDGNGVLVQTNTVSSSENFGYGEWQHYGDAENKFTSIRVCNQLIEKIDEFTKVEASLREKYKAESRILRAYHYMNLTLFYGDVPIVETVKNEFEGGLERKPASEVRDWILNEFDLAIAVLPVENDPRRFNKAAAYALKARASYYFGNYEAAKEAAKYVIDNGGYQLQTISTLSNVMLKDAEFYRSLVDFEDLGIDEETFIKGIFNYASIWDVDYNPEVILAKEYLPSEEYGDYFRVTILQAPNTTDKQAWAVIAPLQDLVDDYWTSQGDTKPTLDDNSTRIADYKSLINEIEEIKKGPDGNPNTNEDNLSFSQSVASIANEIPTKAYMKQFLNRDSRLYASIVFPFTSLNKYIDGAYNEYKPDVPNYGRTGFTYRKMSGANDVASGWGDSYYLSGSDFPILRLGEMLLIYAEAQTQVLGFDSSVAIELNKLRTRCGMPNVPVSFSSKEEAINFIRRERRIELAGEGFRNFDIRLYEDSQRNGGIKGEQAASVVMQGQSIDPVGNISALMVWDDRLMYMPLPYTALDKNPALVQNQGY